MKMVYDAAEELVHACVSFAGGRPEGGIATGIGMIERACLLRYHWLILAGGVPGRLNVEMRVYKPMIRCYGLPESVRRPSGCSRICDEMRLSNEHISVRHAQQSALDIVVPYSVPPCKLAKQRLRFPRALGYY